MNQIIKTHLQSIHEIKQLYEKNKIQHKENEALIVDLYHMLECLKLDAPSISKIAKKLGACLRNRREFKEVSNACEMILTVNADKIMSIEEFEQRCNKRTISYAAEAFMKYKNLFDN